MKKTNASRSVIFSLFFACIASISHGQNVQSHLLDGTEIEYTYPNEGTVIVTFHEGLLDFKWIAGPFSGEHGGGHVYRARKISNDEYLVNWYELDTHDFITLLINFANKKVYGSVLSGKDASVIFDEANIQRVVRK